MNTSLAKKLTFDFLNRNRLPYEKLTARTVHVDRESFVFVKVHGWKPSPMASQLKQHARERGYRVEFAGYPG